MEGLTKQGTSTHFLDIFSLEFIFKVYFSEINIIPLHKSKPGRSVLMHISYL